MTESKLEDFEESSSDEFANIAIRTHELCAERIRLQEKLNNRRKEIQEELKELQNQLDDANLKLEEAENPSPTLQISTIPEKRSIPTTVDGGRKTIGTMHAEKELYSAKQQLEFLKEDYNNQLAKQENEIKQLLKKAKRSKQTLEEVIKNVEKKQNENNDAMAINQDLQIKIYQVKKEKKAVENEAIQIEKQVMDLIQEARVIVSSKYRGRSRQLKT